MFNCRSYCLNFNKEKVDCIICMERVIFKIKGCYNPREEK